MGAVVKRGTRDPVAHYSEYRQPLRYDFWFACAYCSITEVEAQGINFEIDHFVPRSRNSNLEHLYSNLMYACGVCNRRKGNAPPPELEARGLRFIRADEEDPRDHLALDGVDVRPTTKVGEYTLEMLDLNRTALKRLRKIREKFWESKDDLMLGVQGLRSLSIDRFPQQLRAKILAIKRHFGDLEQKHDAALEQLLREVNRSPLLDDDPDAEARRRARQSYLKAAKSIGPY